MRKVNNGYMSLSLILMSMTMLQTSLKLQFLRLLEHIYMYDTVGPILYTFFNT